MDKMQIENLKVLYPKHTKVQLVHMRDEYAPPEGTIGYVTSVDDMGTIHVNWQNGSTLGLVEGVDIFYVLSRPYEAMAHIHSLNGQMAEITVIEKVGDNDYIKDLNPIPKYIQNAIIKKDAELGNKPVGSTRYYTSQNFWCPRSDLNRYGC